jgi:hypothetical protein
VEILLEEVRPGLCTCSGPELALTDVSRQRTIPSAGRGYSGLTHRVASTVSFTQLSHLITCQGNGPRVSGVDNNVGALADRERAKLETAAGAIGENVLLKI